MALTINREPTNEIVSPKNFIPDVISKDFAAGEETQAVRSVSTNYILTDKIDKFDFTDSKLEMKLVCEYYHWGGNKKIMDTINKQSKSPKTFPLQEK